MKTWKAKIWISPGVMTEIIIHATMATDARTLLENQYGRDNVVSIFEVY